MYETIQTRMNLMPKTILKIPFGLAISNRIIESIIFKILYKIYLRYLDRIFISNNIYYNNIKNICYLYVLCGMYKHKLFVKL